MIRTDRDWQEWLGAFDRVRIEPGRQATRRKARPVRARTGRDGSYGTVGIGVLRTEMAGFRGLAASSPLLTVFAEQEPESATDSEG